MAKGFKINRQEIRRFTRDLQREFDKNPVSIPVKTQRPRRTDIDITEPFGPPAPSGVVNNFHGDFINSPMVWGGTNVSLTQNIGEAALGFEAVAKAVAEVLRKLPVTGLSEEDRKDVEEAGAEVLLQTQSSQPDRGKVRRALAAMRGLLAPAAQGATAGTMAGVQEWAQTAIEQLVL